jgi:deoxycytidine triphosphate deaminase
MMLSDADIKRVVESGELKVSPYSSQWIRSSGITMHLGAELLKPQSGHVVDVMK